MTYVSTHDICSLVSIQDRHPIVAAIEMPKLLQLCASDGSDTTQTRADDFKFDARGQPSHEPGKFEGTQVSWYCMALYDTPHTQRLLHANQLRLLDDVNPFAGNSLPLDAQASAPLTGGWDERRGSVKVCYCSSLYSLHDIAYTHPTLV